MRQRIRISFVITLVLLTSLSSSARNYAAIAEVVVPRDMIFRLELLSPISTATNKKGDEFTCKVLSPTEFANAYVSGRIVKVKSSGKVSGKSKMALAFDRITMPDERTGKFSGEIMEVYDVEGTADRGRADNEGTVTSKSLRKRDALKIGIAGGIGALLGGIFLGREGAIIGGAIAAGFALTNTLTTKGPDLTFKERTQFTIRTDTRRSKKE
jgi:hypothetical protein